MKMDVSDWMPPIATMDLQSHQVDIWRISLDLPPATVKLMESTLSADEAQLAARFHFPADKVRYIATHGCLHDILSRYLHYEPGQLTFSNNQYGKPALNNHKLEFNLSHSSDFSLVAITRDRKVGVDVECIRMNMEHESIANRFFSANEVSELMALPADLRIVGFFNCWTRKEAYIKAQGMGLSLPLESFDVSLTPSAPVTLRATRPDSDMAALWTIMALEVAPGYSAAVSVFGQDLELRLWDWNSD